MFCVLVFFGMTGPVIVFALLAVAYTFLYFGVELIVLGAAIDAYFGFNSGGVYVYTLCIAAGLLVVQYLKPYLKVYNH